MPKAKPLRDLGLAITLLTAVPLPVRWPADSAETKRLDVASWFPLVGLLIGIVLAVIVSASGRFFYGLSGLAAAILLAAVAVLTRGLHWDGLADCADGWFVAKERRLEVMADSQIGAFGALAIVLVALIQWSALIESAGTASTAALLVLVPIVGRLAATFSAWLGKPAKPEGLGASVIRRPKAIGVAVAVVAVVGGAGVALLLGAQAFVTAIMLIVGLIFALVVPHLVALRFGGVTGDTMGASVMIAETAMLIALVTIVAVLRQLGVSS